MDACSSPWELEGPVVGTVVGTTAGCSFRDTPEWMACDPSHLELATEAGTVSFGICVPGGFVPPPKGRVVSVQITHGGDFCESFNRTFTVRDGSGKLLIHGVSNETLSIPEISTITREPLCHTESAESSDREMSLRISTPAGAGTVRAGQSRDIGDLNVTVYAAGEHSYCDGDSECGYTYDVAVVRPGFDVMDASVPPSDASVPDIDAATMTLEP